MSDLTYVAAAYVVVLGSLVGYVISLVRRTRGAAVRLRAINARRDPPTPPRSPEPKGHGKVDLDPPSR